MRAVVQRVREAQVLVDGKTVGEIGHGLLVFLGITHADEEGDADYLVSKILHLRIFKDSEGKFNLSLRDSKGSLMVVSQFTLLGDCRKGRRPSFTDAAFPEKAHRLYDYFIASVAEHSTPGKQLFAGTGRPVATRPSAPSGGWSVGPVRQFLPSTSCFQSESDSFQPGSSCHGGQLFSGT